MRVLIINGSPRPGGNVERLLLAMADELAANSAEVELVNIAGTSVAPCRGCMSCRSTKQCILPTDDAQKILAMIDRCDALIIGSPCYWGNMPGQLKALFDRMVYGLIDHSPRNVPLPLHKGKRAVIVALCTTARPWNRLFGQSSGTVRAIKEILKWSGFTIAASMQRGDTQRHLLSDNDFSKARRLARRLL